MRFGRSRVQERAPESEGEQAIDDSAPAIDQSRAHEAHGSATRFDSALSAEAEVYMAAGMFESPESSESAGNSQVDALRAATTAADSQPPQSMAPQWSADQAAEIDRLHAASSEAEGNARRSFAKPGARKHLRAALKEEADALSTMGFATFDEFSAARAAAPSETEPEGGSAQTIARIEQMLNEIGIDAGGDPLEAARAFLATHESEMALGSVGGIIEATTPQEIEVEEIEVEHFEVEAHATEESSLEEPEVGTGEPAAAFEDPESEAPWVPAAQLPAASPLPAADHDEDVAERWIHAEARAERMHSEVDRAQAELESLLARSADLEQTVVDRVDERDSAHAELEAARARVTELETAIAQSGAEREEIESALVASRERIAELDGIVAEREEAYAAAERERASAIDRVGELEANLATRTLELDDARTTVANLEDELAAKATQLEQSDGDLGTARAAADELRAELETTRRSLDALDEHAESIEAELAEERRKAESPETQRELEGVRRELTAARAELGELESRRMETEAAISRDTTELARLQQELTTTRDATENIRSELNAARSAFEATDAQIEAAEHARQAITIDAADLLARAEAEATNLIQRANRDAEAIRQEALLASSTNRAMRADEIPDLVTQVTKLERKLAKQRKRLDRIIQAQGEQSAAPVAFDPVPEPEVAEHERAGHEETTESAARTDWETVEIRRAVRRDRERFRDELVELLNRLTPPEEDDSKALEP